MDDLKHCPFCGGKAYIKASCITERRGFDPESKCQVICKKCGASSAVRQSMVAAIDHWNRRTPEWIPATKKRPEELDTFIGLDKSGRVFETVNAFDEMEWITHWMPMPEPPKDWKEGVNE